MSDEKPAKDEKELKDEELDKVSGGIGGHGETMTSPTRDTVVHNPNRFIEK